MQEDSELSALTGWMLKEYEDAEAKGLSNFLLSQRLDPELLKR